MPHDTLRFDMSIGTKFIVYIHSCRGERTIYSIRSIDFCCPNVCAPKHQLQVDNNYDRFTHIDKNTSYIGINIGDLKFRLI